MKVNLGVDAVPLPPSEQLDLEARLAELCEQVKVRPVSDNCSSVSSDA